MLAILLLINTPVLDFRAISARSQIARVESGEIQPIEFDFRYAREMLARPGYLAVQGLIDQLGFDPLADDAPQGIVVRRADGTVDADMAVFRDEFWAQMHYRGGAFAVPDGVRTAIDGVLNPENRIEYPTLARVELDGDATLPEYLLLGVHRFDGSPIEDLPARVFESPTAYAIVDAGRGWELVGMSTGPVRISGEIEALVGVLREAPIERVGRRYDDLRIGETLFAFPPQYGRPGGATAD